MSSTIDSKSGTLTDHYSPFPSVHPRYFMMDILMQNSSMNSKFGSKFASICASRFTALLISCLFFSTSSFAVSQQELAINGMAATCANCHGTFGKSIQDGALPSLAGMKNDYFIEQMQAFKSGARKATIMHQLAKGYNDQQIKDLAAYFAAQSR
jgi:cytochrome subunit of sulfide dehydrogenase